MEESFLGGLFGQVDKGVCQVYKLPWQQKEEEEKEEGEDGRRRKKTRGIKRRRTSGLE